jgi:hypothetical protein
VIDGEHGAASVVESHRRTVPVQGQIHGRDQNDTVIGIYYVARNNVRSVDGKGPALYLSAKIEVGAKSHQTTNTTGGSFGDAMLLLCIIRFVSLVPTCLCCCAAGQDCGIVRYTQVSVCTPWRAPGIAARVCVSAQHNMECTLNARAETMVRVGELLLLQPAHYLMFLPSYSTGKRAHERIPYRWRPLGWNRQVVDMFVERLCLNSNVVLPVVYATLGDVLFRTVNCSPVGNHKSGLPPTPMGVPKWASPPIHNRLVGAIATAS